MHRLIILPRTSTRTVLARTTFLSTLLSTTLTGSPATAQPAEPPARATPAEPLAASASASGRGQVVLEPVVITGTASARTKLSAPYAISTFDDTEIERNSPMSTVDLLKRVPGFSVEASGGQGGGQNIYARGLPGGGWFYVQLQLNGLTLFDEPQESFLNIDNLFRLDMMTERVEVVRGGTSPIFANNAPGGTVNILTRHGSDEPEGAVRLTTGSHDLRRFDGYVSGPVNDRLSYAFGGFYREGNGFREPGYKADKGGQLTGAATLKLDGGRIEVDAKVLNDRTAFYTGIPLADPRNPSVSLAGQLDPGTGTLSSADFRHIEVRTFDNGTASRSERDLANGIHTDLKQLGVLVDHALAGGWKVTNRFGVVDASVSYDAVFSGASPQGGDAYLASKLAAAQKGFGASVTRVGYALANVRDASGGRVSFDPATTGGLVLESQINSDDTDLHTVTDDLRFGKTFDLGVAGKHDLAFGAQYSHFRFRQNRQPDTILTSLVNQPKALDVLAYNAAGQVVGSVTEDGFVRYGNGVARGEVGGAYTSFYLSDAWKATDWLTLDAGVRRTIFSERGTNSAATSVNEGDPTTLADDNVGGFTGASTYKKESLKGSSYTLGASVQPAPGQQLFARYTRSVRFPRLQNIYLLQTNPVTAIQQAEAGWRTSGPLAFSAIGFWSHFNRLSLNGLVLDPATGNQVTLPLLGETRTVGVEGEVTWRASHNFSLNGNLTLQQPKTLNLVNGATGASGLTVNDKQIAQIPKLLASLQPVVDFRLGDRPVELSATVTRVGQRFVDYANTTAMPAYTTVDLALLASLTSSWNVSFEVRNLTDSHGLTEGNPRTDSLTGQGTATAIYGRPIFGRNFQASLTYRW